MSAAQNQTSKNDNLKNHKRKNTTLSSDLMFILKGIDI
jgi:hypothetical protein